jgi:hypothetical protein
MDFNPLTFPIRVVSTLFGLVFSLAIVEFLGLLFYGAMTDEAAAQALMQNTSDPARFPGRWLEYVQASPDRMVVALLLAGMVTLLVLTGSTSNSTTRSR